MIINSVKIYAFNVVLQINIIFYYSFHRFDQVKENKKYLIFYSRYKSRYLNDTQTYMRARE